MNYIKLVGGIIATLIFAIFAITRIAVEAIGWTTTPSDLDALLKKMPAMLRWLFSTPWPVPTTIMFAIAAFAAWLLWSGTRKTVADKIADTSGLTEDDVKRLVAESIASATLEPHVDAAYVQKAINEALEPLQIPEFKTAIAQAMKVSSDGVESAKKRNDEEKSDYDARLKTLSEQIARIAAFAEQRSRSLNDRLDWVGQGFAAIGHWEWHKGAFAEILDRGESLRGIADYEIDDKGWQEWERVEKVWRGEIVSWAVVAEWYAPNAAESVWEIPDHLYYGEWTIEEGNFGKADRVKRYKDAMIILHNLKSVQEHVETGIKSAAFQGVGKKARIGQVPPGINQLT